MFIPLATNSELQPLKWQTAVKKVLEVKVWILTPTLSLQMDPNAQGYEQQQYVDDQGQYQEQVQYQQ